MVRYSCATRRMRYEPASSRKRQHHCGPDVTDRHQINQENYDCIAYFIAYSKSIFSISLKIEHKDPIEHNMPLEIIVRSLAVLLSDLTESSMVLTINNNEIA